MVDCLNYLINEMILYTNDILIVHIRCEFLVKNKRFGYSRDYLHKKFNELEEEQGKLEA